MNTIISLAYECLIRIASLFHRHRRHARFIVLLGGPGAGKGTIASKLGPRLGLPHLSTGNLIRREIAAQTPIGRVWGPEIAKGRLLPDHVVLHLLKRELSKPAFQHGAILDGFPRTRRQAVRLRRMLALLGNQVEAVVLLQVSAADLIERLSLRRTCTNVECARTYHLKFSPPRVEGQCDVCGAPIAQRSDETVEALDERMREFDRTFEPLRLYYQGLGLLAPVRSTNDKGPQQVFEAVLCAIEDRA